MTKPGDKNASMSALRTAAEAKLNQSMHQEILHGRPKTTLPPPTDNLLQELQVHQIELEMQNDALQKAQSALEESRDRYLDLYEFAPVGYLTLTLEGLIGNINLTGALLLGYERAKLLQRGLTSLVVPDDQDRWTRHLIGLRRDSGSGKLEVRLRRKDGSVFEALLDCVMPLDLCLRVALSDISARKLAEEKLRIAGTVFTHAREGVLITDHDAHILEVNDAFTRITGYARHEALGQNPRFLNSGRQDAAFYQNMWQSLTEKGHWYGEVWNRRKSGELYAEWLNISSVRDAAGKLQQYVGLISDITALKEHQHQLEHIAHYDALTNLPNRVLLADRLHQGMASALRRGQCLAVVYLDLDGFKGVNDQHGHGIGDQLLSCLANRMKAALREGDTLARLGGDEFVAVLNDLPDSTNSVPTLTRLIAATASPVEIGSVHLQVSASLGVTFYPQAEESGDTRIDADTLLRQADQAMYQAKQAGKNRYHVFDAELDRSVRGHHESLDRLRLALIRNEFVLFYQPKVNMRTGEVVGAEALIRWQHPEKGLLPPAAFLPLIEDNPLAIEVGEWVIDTALNQMALWQSTGLTLPVSVNVGARQLQHKTFTSQLRASLAAHPEIGRGRLELEVLETSALEDLAQVSLLIEDCRQLGVRFALDDFGTGYSSLTYLKRLSVAQLKIDQSFVRDMLDDPDDLAILEGVIGLANAFRREIIAEGVETIEHGEMLLQLGCDLAQGYGIARPMAADKLPGWLHQWQPDPRWLALKTASRDNLPLLLAAVEHRVWFAALMHYLKGERSTPPQLDPALCRFGVWLASHPSGPEGFHDSIKALHDLHRGTHDLAVEISGSYAATGVTERQLGKVKDLSDRLLKNLENMTRARNLQPEVVL